MATAQPNAQQFSKRETNAVWTNLARTFSGLSVCTLPAVSKSKFVRSCRITGACAYRHVLAREPNASLLCRRCQVAHTRHRVLQR